LDISGCGLHGAVGRWAAGHGLRGGDADFFDGRGGASGGGEFEYPHGGGVHGGGFGLLALPLRQREPAAVSSHFTAWCGRRNHRGVFALQTRRAVRSVHQTCAGGLYPAAGAAYPEPRFCQKSQKTQGAAAGLAGRCGRFFRFFRWGRVGAFGHQHLDCQGKNAAVRHRHGEPHGVFRDVRQCSHVFFAHRVVALGRHRWADCGWGAGRAARRKAGGEVARAADVCAGGGDGDFLECAGAVEGVVRGFGILGKPGAT